MGAPTEVYVDPAINANSGTGTIGDPYGDLQFALNTQARDTTNGNRFNIKAGTEELLTAALSLTTYGTPTATAPLMFQGYTSVTNDGGIGKISLGGGAFSMFASAPIHTYLRHLEVYNGTAFAAQLVNLASNCYIENCIFHTYTGATSVVIINSGYVKKCKVYGYTNGAAYAIQTVASADITDNWCEGSGTNRGIITSTGHGALIARNIIIACGGIGISSSATGGTICNNSILASAGVGTGILIASSSLVLPTILNNIVEGYSGVGGKGFDIGGDVALFGHNAAFNNTTNYNIVADIFNNLGDNEELVSSAFAKIGANTFENRFVYFNPLDIGNILGGAYAQG